MSLTFDGLTGVFQDGLKQKHSIAAHQMMFAVNFLSAIYLTIAIALSGEGVEALGFVQRHPYIILNILAFGIASAIGQVSLYLCCFGMASQMLISF